LKIIKTVSVKQVLTEKSKETLLKRFENEKSQLNVVCEQLEFEKRKLFKKQPAQLEATLTRFEEELTSRHKRIEQIEFEIKQLQILPLGTELQEKKIQAIEEINIGDNWKDVNASSEIVIKDGIIVEIR
jgi:hypothetical protein